MADEPNRARNIERPRGRRRELQPTGRRKFVSMAPGAADKMPMKPADGQPMKPKTKKPMPPGARRHKAGA